MILGVIPARTGSKGILNKNIYPLCDKPLIQWTIDVVKESKIDDFIITSDSIDICNFAEKFVLRFKELAEDDTPMLPVILHAIEKYEAAWRKHVDLVMIIQPTSPLRTTNDINNAIELYKKNNNKCLVSVVKMPNLKKFYDSGGNPLSEQTAYDKHIDSPVYMRNSAIFISSRKLINEGKIFDDNPCIYEMPLSRSIDIDTLDDMYICESILKNPKEVIE